VEIQARVLRELGARHALVVHGLADGLDEISISGETLVAELRAGEIQAYRIRGEDFGLQPHPLKAIQVADAAESAERVRAVLAGKDEAGRAIVALNAGACIYAAGLAPTLLMGVTQAREVIATGLAQDKLAHLVRFSQGLKG
jgi:anthranilate phosphoribosyltransferase